MTKRAKRSRPAIETLEGRALRTAGVADTTFGGTGYVTTAVGSAWDYSEGVAVQTDLKVVVLGQSETSNATKTVSTTLVRYNPDGTLDTSFGNAGKNILWAVNSTSCNDDPRGALAIQPDGKIVVAGLSQNVNGSAFLYVMRLNANGSYDTSFGAGSGKVLVSQASQTVIRPWAVLVQADGKILVQGTHSGTGNPYTLDLLRFNANGTVDSGFGTNGKVVNTTFSTDYLNFAHQGSVVIDLAGRIDVAGFVGAIPSSKLAVVRYNPNGTLDTTFGSGGIASALFAGFTWNQGDSLALQSNGKIVVAGNGILSNTNAPTRPLVLARFNDNGSLDDGSSSDSTPGDRFSTAGFFVDTQVGVNQWASTAIGGDSKIVVLAHTSLAQTYGQMMLTRVLADGSAIDSTFGQNGLTTVNFGPRAQSGDRPSQVVITPDGKFVVTGVLAQSNGSSVIDAARFLGDPAPAMGAASVPTAVLVPRLPDPTLVPLVLDDANFLVTLPGRKRRPAF